MVWKPNKEDGVQTMIHDGTLCNIEYIYDEDMTEKLYHIWISSEFRYLDKKYKRLGNAIKTAEKYIKEIKNDKNTDIQRCI